MCLASIVMTELRSIVDFETAVAERSALNVAPERLLSGTPEQKVANFFSDTTGQFHCGVWESSPGKWKVRYTENEFCYLTAGKIRISDADGRSKSFGPGASFVIPAGFEGEWEVIESARKLYVIFEKND